MLTRYRFLIADVFTESAFGGNQLAVFPDAIGLSDRAMQALAREFNFAETTFVLPPAESRHTSRVRIFTPKAEIPFAGHPTIGTAAVLAWARLISVPEGRATVILEEGVGPIAVDITAHEDAVFARFTFEKQVEVPAAHPSRKAAAEALSLADDAVKDAWFASIGLPFCFVHLADQQAVDRAALNADAWARGLAKAWASNLFFFSGDISPGSRLHARMFAPALGITEDPATGSAAAALAGWLALRVPDQDGTFKWQIEQGVTMGRPSLIEASAEKRRGDTVNVKVGGTSVIVGEGTMIVPHA